ncbi:MAG: porin family protein [Pseudomonadota bacterium]
MARTRFIAAGIAIAAASVLSQSAAATEAPASWFVGADVGHARLSLDNQSTIGATDLSDTAVSVRGGRAFGRYFSVEATYSDLGNYRYVLDTCPEACIPEVASTEFRHSGTRVDLSLVGRVPLGNGLEAFGRAGLASTTLETEARTMLGVTTSDSNDLSGVYGLGLRAFLDSSWSLRLQWDRVSHSKGMDLDVDAFWLGAEYRFGRRPR